MNADPVLELSGITCTFDDGGSVVTALDDVFLTLRRGHMLAVMGPSGSGKSTLLHVACGLVVPTSGRLSVLGEQPPRSWSRRKLQIGAGGRELRLWWAHLRRQSIGVVHQRLNLMPALSALDNVALPLRLAGTSRAAADAAARRALDEVDAGDLARVHIDRLSTGQQQRIALARAIVGDRTLILADEPTAALDTVGAEQITDLLAHLASHGRAVLMVTHDGRLASWADDVVVLRDGQVVDRVQPEPAPEHETAAS
jgi:putative ABC transport system ATP-binding protein